MAVLSFPGLPRRSPELLRSQPACRRPARACWPTTATARAGATANLAVHSKQSGSDHARLSQATTQAALTPLDPDPLRPTHRSWLPHGPLVRPLNCLHLLAHHTTSHGQCRSLCCRSFRTVFCGCSPPRAPAPVSEPSPPLQFANSDPFARARIVAVQSRVSAPVV